MGARQTQRGDADTIDPLAGIKRATILVGKIQDGVFLPLGTGFVYVHTPLAYVKNKSEPDEKGYVYYWAQLWVVTCRHVINGIQTPAIRFNNSRGGTDVYPIHARDWWWHRMDDVAVAPVPTTKNLGRLPDESEIAYVATERDVGNIDNKLTVPRHRFGQLNFIEQTPVSVVGYPTGMIEGGRKDYPVVRTGHIAQVQGFIDGDPAHRSFLIESGSSPGNSGGPVVVAKGTPSLDRHNAFSDTVVIGMVSHKLDIEVHGESEKLGESSAHLAEVVPIDAVNRTIGDYLASKRKWEMPPGNHHSRWLGRGGTILPPKYLFAVNALNHIKHVEWTHRKSGEMTKRAWIEHRPVGADEDWASAPEGRYIVVASLVDGEPHGTCDFPVFSTSDDELVLREFLHAVSPVVTAADSPPGV